ncbi:MAG: S8 family serine peptidase [Verrucomicrobiales bacterium]
MLRAYSRTEGTPTFKIALIDGPVARDHPSLTNAPITELAVPSDSNSASPSRRHATFMASILVGQSDEVVGLCPACTVLSLPAVDDDMVTGRTSARETAQRIAACVGRAVEADADLVVLSLEFAPRQQQAFQIVADAIARAAARGVRTVLPAGNQSSLDPGLVAAAPGAVPVALGYDNGLVHPRATLGMAIAQRGLLAPGVDIPGALSTGGYALRSGSSFSAALVAGAAGLLSGLLPRATRDDIWRILLDQAGTSPRFSPFVPRTLDLERGLSHWANY